MIVVSLVIGMGIFKTPATIAAKSGTPLIFFSAWIIGGIIALFGALTYAEIGQRLPVMGGYYKVFAHCYHPGVGFTINVLILISNAASLALNIPKTPHSSLSLSIYEGKPPFQILNKVSILILKVSSKINESPPTSPITLTFILFFVA